MQQPKACAPRVRQPPARLPLSGAPLWQCRNSAVSLGAAAVHSVCASSLPVPRGSPPCAWPTQPLRPAARRAAQACRSSRHPERKLRRARAKQGPCRGRLRTFLRPQGEASFRAIHKSTLLLHPAPPSAPQPQFPIQCRAAFHSNMCRHSRTAACFFFHAYLPFYSIYFSRMACANVRNSPFERCRTPSRRARCNSSLNSGEAVLKMRFTSSRIARSTLPEPDKPCILQMRWYSSSMVYPCAPSSTNSSKIC